MSIEELENGSDIRGISIALNDQEKVNLTASETYKITKGFITYLCKHNKPCKIIGVGHDPRITADSLKAGIITACNEKKVTVFDCGLSTTPSMFMSTIFKETNFDASIMITASHLPYNRNGMKFFTKDGGLDASDIKEIIAYAKTESVYHKKEYDYKEFDIISLYAKHLVNLVKRGTGLEKPLTNLHIIVDSGNGSGGFFASQVLKPLGANTKGSQFIDPDGRFPNHIPNPENQAAIASISKKTVATHADLGIIFDTDVDRAAVIDKNGDPINRNTMIALLAKIVLEDHPKTTIVTDSVTSDGLTKFIEKNGGLHYRYKRGYKNVINKAISLNKEGQDCQLAIETSGHGAFKENYFLDDGAYIVTKILIKMASLEKQNKDIFSLIYDLEQPQDSIEIRRRIQVASYKTYGKTILTEFENFAKESPYLTLVKPNYEGVKVNYSLKGNSGWLLMRMSLHDPVIAINIESSQKNGTKVALKLVEDFLKKYNLEQFKNA